MALVDSLGTWVTLQPKFDIEAHGDDLLAALVGRNAPTVLVSEEVGLAVHPPTSLGRRYVETVGMLNQRIAAVSDRVLFVMAGRALELPGTVPGRPDVIRPPAGADAVRGTPDRGHDPC